MSEKRRDLCVCGFDFGLKGGQTALGLAEIENGIFVNEARENLVFFHCFSFEDEDFVDYSVHESGNDDGIGIGFYPARSLK